MNIKRIIREEITNTEEDWEWAGESLDIPTDEIEKWAQQNGSIVSKYIQRLQELENKLPKVDWDDRDNLFKTETQNTLGIIQLKNDLRNIYHSIEDLENGIDELRSPHILGIKEEIDGFKDSSDEDFDWAKDTPASGEGKFLDKFLDKPVSVTKVRFGDYCNNRTGYMGSFILRQEDGGFIIIYKEEDENEVGIGFSGDENGIENLIGYDYRQDNEHSDCSQDEIDVVKQVFPKTVGCKVI